MAQHDESWLLNGRLPYTVKTPKSPIGEFLSSDHRHRYRVSYAGVVVDVEGVRYLQSFCDESRTVQEVRRRVYNPCRETTAAVRSAWMSFQASLPLPAGTLRNTDTSFSGVGQMADAAPAGRFLLRRPYTGNARATALFFVAQRDGGGVRRQRRARLI